jgi:primary-amine oxidase
MWQRHPGFWLLAIGLLLAPLGWPGHQAGSQSTDLPGAVAFQQGRQVSWQGWQFHWSIHRRNGLVLEKVTFQGRSVLKYAGLAEIFVPYNRGQPRPEDFGDGIGPKMVELFPGQDCVPGALTCRSWNAQGKEEGKRLVMLHEEAAGLSYLGNLGRAYGKMLILWCAYDLDGYYYISRWRFHDDGCLIPEVGLTGPLQHLGTGHPSPYGSLVAKERVFAPSHVHNFYYCLDFDIDGPDHDLVEEFNYQQDQPGSLSGKHSWTPLTKETARSASAANFRSWRVVNPSSKNALGLPRSYELVPGGNGIYRGGAGEKFAQAELWVTRQHAREHPHDLRPLRVALPSYLNGESIEGQDVVVWYVVHVHHLPRTEDWPGMPVHWVGFTLKPRDFLDASPVQPK